MKVVVKRAEIKRMNSAQASGMQEYKMEASPRGLALIIEIEQYTNDVFEKRTGSEVSELFFSASNSLKVYGSTLQMTLNLDHFYLSV